MKNLDIYLQLIVGLGDAVEALENYLDEDDASSENDKKAVRMTTSAIKELINDLCLATLLNH